MNPIIDLAISRIVAAQAQIKALPPSAQNSAGDIMWNALFQAKEIISNNLSFFFPVANIAFLASSSEIRPQLVTKTKLYPDMYSMKSYIMSMVNSVYSNSAPTPVLKVFWESYLETILSITPMLVSIPMLDVTSNNNITGLTANYSGAAKSFIMSITNRMFINTGLNTIIVNPNNPSDFVEVKNLFMSNDPTGSISLFRTCFTYFFDRINLMTFQLTCNYVLTNLQTGVTTPMVIPSYLVLSTGA